MSTTVGTLEHEARVILLDTDDSNYRFTPYVLFCGIRDGLKRLYSVRPESRYSGLTLTAATFPTVTADMDSAAITAARAALVLIEERWFEAVIYYACHKAYLIDSSDTANAALSADYLSKFEGIART
jgi:hypothetical protein